VLRVFRPALDIADDALELLFEFYKKQRPRWLEGEKPPYLTYQGNIVSGKRLEAFLSAIGAHETPYYDNKKRVEIRENEHMRSQYKKLGMSITVFV
jgi:5'-3' exonuclease